MGGPAGMIGAGVVNATYVDAVGKIGNFQRVFPWGEGDT